MKITTILGSPRKKGNTAKVLGSFEERMAKEHEVDRINLLDYEVNGCLGCGSCQKTADEPGCVQKDDAIAVFERMISSNAIVYASPLYCWGFSAQTKALIDRHFCLVTGYGTPDHRSLIKDKTTALLVTCAGPIENNADLIQGIFDRVSNFSGCNVAGKYVVPFCTTPDALGDEAIEIAGKMERDILSA